MSSTALPVVLAPASTAAPARGAYKVLPVEGGHIAYEDLGGSGPLVVAVPGLGDTRGEYRFLGLDLVKRGFHVVTVDLRGHGDSSTGFSDVSVPAVTGDVVALLKHLGEGKATIIGTSFGAAVAAHTAVLAPELVERVVVIGPFVRDTRPSLATRWMMRVLFAGPWRVAAWMSYFGSLFPTRTPADHQAYLAALRKNLSEPGRFDAVKGMLDAGRAETAPRLGEVKAPVLVVMGTKDPDFKSPAEEARLVAEALRARVLMVEGAGHYPHVEMPEVVSPAVAAFLEGQQ